MKNKKLNIGVSDIVLTVIAAVFLIGICTVFKPCGPKEDGGYMTCHWAGQAITGLSAVLLVISVMHMFIPDEKIKQGLSLAVIPVALLAAIIPGRVISLCMMDMMRCRAVMKPAVMIISVLMILAACFDLVMRGRKK